MTLASLGGRMRNSLYLFIVAFILILRPGPGVHAASITVNDSCSLVDAITAANTDTATGGCAAGSGADTITLTSDVEVPDGPLRVTSEITIDGGYHCISGPQDRRLFEVSDAGNLHLHRVKLSKTAGGSYVGRGGIAYNNGTLRVTKSTFENSTATFGGGFIYNSGQLAVDGSFFRNGRTTQGSYVFGGAILNRGNATITNSTFTENSAYQGGAIAAVNDDYYNRTGRRVVIANSTFVNNRGITASGTTLLDSWGTFKLYNSVLVGPRSTNPCRFVSSGNMSHNYSAHGCWPSTGGNLRLGALVEPVDGSPPYFPLQDGSVGLGTGHPDHCPATDQLGNARPLPAGSMANCDLGAVESAFALPTPTATATLRPTITPTGTMSPTAAPPVTAIVPSTSIVVNASCSLRDAINSANTDTAVGGCTAGSLDRDAIVLTQDITASYTLPLITSKLRIEGGRHLITVGRNIRPFEIAGNGNAEIVNLRITRADGLSKLTDSGGFIKVNRGGTLKVRSSAFTKGKASNGGAIQNYGTATIESSYFGGNSASNTGGAFKNYDGSATIFNSTFSENSARLGGTLGNGHDSTLTLTNVTIYASSSSDGWGTALWDDLRMGATSYLNNSIIAGTSSDADCAYPAAMQTVNSYVQGVSCQTTFNAVNSGPINLGSLVEPADGSPPYYPLLNNSPAIGQGDAAHCPATDQLGNARPNPAGSNCDLGAVESDASPPTLTPDPSLTMTMMDGQRSEQELNETPKTTATASPTRDPSDVPRNLNSIVNTNSVTLDWDPPSVDPDGYLILRRSQGDADYIEIDILFAADSEDPTIYSDERLVSADTYEYVVMAIFLDGDASDVSEPVTVTVREEDLASPTATATETPTEAETPTATFTPSPTATDASTATDTPTPTATLTPEPCSLAGMNHSGKHGSSLWRVPGGQRRGYDHADGRHRPEPGTACDHVRHYG